MTNNWLMFPGRQMIRNRMDIMSIVSGDGLLCSSQWQGTLSMSSGYASLMNVYTVAVESSSSTPAAISMPHASKAVVELLNCSKIFYCSLNTCSNIMQGQHILFAHYMTDILTTTFAICRDPQPTLQPTLCCLPPFGTGH